MFPIYSNKKTMTDNHLLKSQRSFDIAVIISAPWVKCIINFTKTTLWNKHLKILIHYKQNFWPLREATEIQCFGSRFDKKKSATVFWQAKSNFYARKKKSRMSQYTNKTNEISKDGNHFMYIRCAFHVSKLFSFSFCQPVLLSTSSFLNSIMIYWPTF